MSAQERSRSIDVVQAELGAHFGLFPLTLFAELVLTFTN